MTSPLLKLAATVLLAGALASNVAAQSTWHLRHPLTAGRELSAVIFGQNQFVAVGDDILTSPDGMNWTRRTPEFELPDEVAFKDVAAGNGRYLAIASRRFDPFTRIAVSTDGARWTQAAELPGIEVFRVVHSFDRFIAFARTGPPPFGDALVVLISPDGSVWIERFRRSFDELQCDAHMIGQSVVGSEVVIGPAGLISTNGLEWTQSPETPGDSCRRVFAFGNGYYVAHTYGDAGSRMWVSTNGVRWEINDRAGIPTGERLHLTYGGGGFIATDFARIWTSKDGFNWTPPVSLPEGIAARTFFELTSSAYGNERFVSVGGYYTGVGDGGAGRPVLLSSSDGLDWMSHQDASRTILGAASSPGRVVALAPPAHNTSERNPVALVSNTGVEWAVHPLNDFNLSGSGIAYANGVFVAPLASQTSSLASSKDGIQWEPLPGFDGSWERLRQISSVVVALGALARYPDDPDTCHRIAWSRDGVSWRTSGCILRGLWWETRLVDAATDGTSFVLTAVKEGQHLILHSSDGESWTETYEAGAEPGTEGLVIAFGNGRYVGLSPLGAGATLALTSQDGVSWTRQEFPRGLRAGGDLIFAAGRFFATADEGIVSSADGIHWTRNRTAFGVPGFLAAGPQGLFGFASGSIIQQSPWDLTLRVLGQPDASGLRLGVSGYDGTTVVLESTPALNSPNWQPIGTNVIANGSAEFLDAGAADAPTRYYRAVAP